MRIGSTVLSESFNVSQATSTLLLTSRLGLLGGIQAAIYIRSSLFFKIGNGSIFVSLILHLLPNVTLKFRIGLRIHLTRFSD